MPLPAVTDTTSRAYVVQGCRTPLAGSDVTGSLFSEKPEYLLEKLNVDPGDGRSGALMPSLEPRRQRFRLRYVRAEGDRGEEVVGEVDLEALDVSAAIRASASFPWPPGAVALHIVDRDGQEVFEQLKAD